MGGRGKTDKSERRNHHPPAKPGDLDQFGQDMNRKQAASSSPLAASGDRGGTV